jgi:hypothetical protein
MALWRGGQGALNELARGRHGARRVASPNPIGFSRPGSKSEMCSVHLPPLRGTFPVSTLRDRLWVLAAVCFVYLVKTFFQSRYDAARMSPSRSRWCRALMGHDRCWCEGCVHCVGWHDCGSPLVGGAGGPWHGRRVPYLVTGGGGGVSARVNLKGTTVLQKCSSCHWVEKHRGTAC